MSRSTKPRRWRLGAALAVPLAAAAAAGACSRVPPQPVAEPENLSVPGLADLAREGGRVRVLHVHGMCTHGERWVAETTGFYAGALGPAVGDGETLPPVAGIERRRRVFRPPGVGEVAVDFLVWSPLTSPFKRVLDYDRRPGQAPYDPDIAYGPDGEFPLVRADINDRLKLGLINDCFTDALVYASGNGEPLRAAMRQAVCVFLGGTPDRAGRCGLDPARVDPAPVALVTESLGSRVVVDAYNAILGEAQEATAAPPDRAAREAVAAQTRHIYLVSNQIPFFTVADPGGPAVEAAPGDDGQAPARPAPPGSASESLLGLLGRLEALGGPAGPRAERAAAAGPAVVLAFTDPNDLLSYRLTDRELAAPAGRFRLGNLLVSNAPTYAGKLEFPWTAHMGYRQNADVIGAIVHGWPPRRP